MKIEKISLFGLGKLGLPLCLVLGKHHKVVGIDKDRLKIEKLCVLDPPFFEPYIESYLEDSKNNINYSHTDDYNIDDFDLSIILVNTPSDKSGEFSNVYLFDVINDLCDKLKKSEKKDFLFIISSTVMPGTHIKIIKLIEEKTNRKYNSEFGLVYIPDLVALGSVFKDFENPDVVILGESSKKYGDIAESVYSKIYQNNPPIVRMSLIESEISKISLNTYITMKISFSNFIGNVSEKFNCDHSKISLALGYDKRISPFYLNSGTAFGGTCFPRDTWAFIKMSENIGLDAVHIKSTQKINENQNLNLINKVLEFNGKTIGIIGLSFKPNTTVTEQSPGFILYNKLKENDFNVITYDKLITTNDSVHITDLILLSDVIVITHNDKDFKNIFSFDLSNKILINPWGLS